MFSVLAEFLFSKQRQGLLLKLLWQYSHFNQYFIHIIHDYTFLMLEPTGIKVGYE